MWRRRRAVLPADWPEVAERWVAAWSWLTDDERRELIRLTDELVGRLRWEPARDLDLTAEMQAVIAAHAALLVLHLEPGADCYAGVSSVIVHRSTIVQRGPRPGPAGTITDSPSYLGGQAHHRGPVLVSWSAVRRQSLHPRWGEHVVLHEFAHRLDMLDGITDGTPPLADEAARARWVEVCTAELEALRAGSGDPPPVLRAYAATNPAEFFAVATETFFTRPCELRDRHPELYAVLAGFYHQDPARRLSGDRRP